MNWWFSESIAYLISVTHDVMCCNQRFKDNDPIGILRALDQKVGQLRDRHIRFICAVYQIYLRNICINGKIFSLPIHNLIEGA